MRLKKKNILGMEVIKLLQQGHAVRRSCWVDGFYIRICNEGGFDDNGNAILQDGVPIYTQATNGFFMHIGHSSQPFNYLHDRRDGEGVAMLFANDWEDYGFMSDDEFNALTEATKEVVRKNERKYIKIVEY